MEFFTPVNFTQVIFSVHEMALLKKLMFNCQTSANCNSFLKSIFTIELKKQGSQEFRQFSPGNMLTLYQPANVGSYYSTVKPSLTGKY